jgi:hypothetical protein
MSMAVVRRLAVLLLIARSELLLAATLAPRQSSSPSTHSDPISAIASTLLTSSLANSSSSSSSVSTNDTSTQYENGEIVVANITVSPSLTSSSLSSMSSSIDVGRIIMQGLGASGTAAATTLSPVTRSSGTTTASIPPTQPIAVSVVSISGIVHTATKLEDGEIVVGNMTVRPTSTTITAALDYNPTQPIATGTITVSGAVHTLTELEDGDILVDGMTIKADPTKVVAVGLITLSGDVYAATRLADGEVLVGNTTIWLPGASAPASTTSSTITTAPARNTTSSGGLARNSTITSTPIKASSTLSIPSGYGIVGNATFLTSCIYGDLSCYNTCTSMANICSTSWLPYNAEYQEYQGLAPGGVWVTLSTATTTLDLTLTSYVLSTSTVFNTFTDPLATVTVTYFEENTDCWSTTVLNSPYTISTVVNTCAESDQQSQVISTRTAPAATYSNRGVYTYAVSTVGVYTTATIVITTYSTYSSVTPASSFPLIAPTCMPQATGYCSYGPNCNSCTIYGGTVQLLYWPVSTTPTLPSNVTTPMATSKVEPVVAVYEGVTITSPSVAISFATAYAVNDCNSTVGKAHTGSILPLAPGDLSSALGNYHDYIGNYRPGSGTASEINSMNAAPFNYADLNWP